MSLESDGRVYNSLASSDPYFVILSKCKEMRRELRRLEQVVQRIEMQAGAKAPLDTMKPNLSAMFSWYLSALESFFAISWNATSPAKTREAIADLARRFATFSSPDVKIRHPG